MKISDCIKIDTVYTRSTNLERDIDSTAIIQSYIPTSRSLMTLRRVIGTFEVADIPRSWALVGPYGSGKSSFAVFLSHLLDNPYYDTTNSAFQVCREADADICKDVRTYTAKSKGYLSILLTGTPEPLGARFIASLRDSVTRFWERICGPRPSIIEKLNEASSRKNLSINDILILVEEVRSIVEEKGGKGLLIIFDELGKFLEYEARHYGANDIYLLQALAEMATKGKKANIYVITLMHQGFEQYARGLGEDLRNEWSKVQGRFENIPFLESTEQTLRVVSKAFNNSLPDPDKRKIYRKSKEIAYVLAANNALPGSLEEGTAAELFSKCYPLHPVTALILPILCQKMAQNERTLFNYFGSLEQHGMRDSLEHLQAIGDWVMPWEIFDYFILNQPAALSDPISHRRWAEVITALDRLGDAPSDQVIMLKTVGLFNIIGAQAGFKASKPLVALCLENEVAMEAATSGLSERSILQFRKFSQEYRVWQGSDFDLDSSVQNEIAQLGRFDLPEAINNRKPLQSIVARRHTIKTGTLRYFNPVFVDRASYKNEPAKDVQQRIVLYLAESNDDLQSAYNSVTSHFSDLDIIAFFPNGSQLREVVAEVLALHRVELNYPELQVDPVAQREFKDRFSAALQSQDELLVNLIEHPGNILWYWRGEPLSVSNKRILQIELSRILDIIYDKAPRIHNELINRNKPSAQASGARNKLVAAMVHNADKVDLGIKKFPAEKGVYRAFLYATGLHKKIESKWKLVPPEKDNPYNFFPVWETIDQFLDSTKDKPRSFAELNEILQAPPFGVKIGVLPLLYLSVFLCNQEDLALYEDGVYTPYISDQHIERFMKRPGYFTVQRIRIDGIRASLFKQYIKVLYSDREVESASLLTVAKPLSQFMIQLPEYTKQTSRISDSSQKVRKAFELAKSPLDLLFVRLPKACGFPAIDPEESDERIIEGFTGTLVYVIKELRDAHKKMTTEFKENVCRALFPDIKEKIGIKKMRQDTCSIYGALLKHTADTKGLRPFIEHLANKKGDDELWFNRLLLFLGGRASDKWLDVHRDGAVKRLEELSRRLIDLRVLQSHYLKAKNRFGDGFEVIRLRSMRHGYTDHDEIVKIDSATQKYIDSRKKRFEEFLKEELDNDESRLALLADLVDRFLERKKNNAKSNNSTTDIKVKKVNE